MPEPGGSVHVGGGRLTVAVAICLFFAWWLVFWAAWDLLLKGQIFGNTDTGPASGDLVFAVGAVLAALGITLLMARATQRLLRRRSEAGRT